MSSSSNSPNILKSPEVSNVIFLICDVQETFRGKISNWNLIVSSIIFLLNSFLTLSVPIIISEQKPFKPTIEEIKNILNSNEKKENSPPSEVITFSKSQFSMITEETKKLLKSENFKDRNHIVIVGLESHACIYQTILDLIRSGFIVHLPLESIGSMNSIDSNAALERFRNLSLVSGSLNLCSAEQIIYEILKDSEHKLFKSILPFVKIFGAAKKTEQK